MRVSRQRHETISHGAREHAVSPPGSSAAVNAAAVSAGHHTGVEQAGDAGDSQTPGVEQAAHGTGGRWSPVPKSSPGHPRRPPVIPESSPTPASHPGVAPESSRGHPLHTISQLEPPSDGTYVLKENPSLKEDP
jgi:hypothetical protein